MQDEDSYYSASGRRTKPQHFATYTLIALALVAAVAGSLLWRPWQKSETLPKNILANIQTFQPYYFASGPPPGFVLDRASVAYTQDVLLFRLYNATLHQTVSATEQLLPSSLASMTYPDATNVSGTDGKAFIKYDGDRVMGALFSSARHGRQTFVILSSTDPIPQSQVEDMLRALRPAN